MMWLWVRLATQSQYLDPDWLLIRVSLSFADALGIGALGLALYTYRLYRMAGVSEAYAYLTEFVVVLRRHMVEPERAAKITKRMMGVFELGADRLERLVDMPEDEFAAVVSGAKRRPLRAHIAEPHTDSARSSDVASDPEG